MTKKKGLLIGCVVLILVVIAAGVAAFMWAQSNLTFTGKSELTINGETVITYSALTLYEELNPQITEYYDISNSVAITTSKESEIKKIAADAVAKLDEIEKFMNDIDEIKGEGAEELRAAVSTWITERKTCADLLNQIATIIGEDGEVSTQAEAEQANALIAQYDALGKSSTTAINDARDVFYDANK